mmetsp:Transcript_37529/g.60085  ORF Transcript_37529/g.60085 Transcript_37529/m.60085 type:complete len:177 (-) Transcript_37529:211-741(-)|eukprot:CAMPEP_0197038142 /NCGR_PEP_ID=MMETSP1384-20130603/15143_1 /TAXON_ID=29189 /ORGANISM="Ammonia sp." /LENGTH=176 /DNA_ID=CAMNT_0042468537 /DNA_START=30 /DNA_END=560 /DNA_ORIENTATION=-
MSKGVGLTQKIESALLSQIKSEFRVSQFYLSSSYFFTHRHFHGISSFLKTEYQSEVEHAYQIADYMTTRGTDLTNAIIEVQAETHSDPSIKEEISKWKQPVDIFRFLFQAEQQNQCDINELMTLAQTEHDHATYQFLLDFMKAQVECTHEIEDMLVKVQAYSKFDGLLWHLDKMVG